jgi:hypothetical protein
MQCFLFLIAPPKKRRKSKFRAIDAQVRYTYGAPAVADPPLQDDEPTGSGKLTGYVQDSFEMMNTYTMYIHLSPFYTNFLILL